LVQVFQAEPFGPILVMRGVSLIIGKELDGLEEA
jgi:hypothetical protein